MKLFTADPLITRTAELLRQMREDAERFLQQTEWAHAEDLKIRARLAELPKREPRRRD